METSLQDRKQQNLLLLARAEKERDEPILDVRATQYPFSQGVYQLPPRFLELKRYIEHLRVENSLIDTEEEEEEKNE